MRISIQWLSEVTPTPLEVESSDTIHTVLAKFEKESGLQTDGRVLRLDETELQDDQSLADYNIEEGTTLRFFEKNVPSRSDKHAIFDTAVRTSIIRTSLNKTDREESDPEFEVGGFNPLASVVRTFPRFTDGLCHLNASVVRTFPSELRRQASVVRTSPSLTDSYKSDSKDKESKSRRRFRTPPSFRGEKAYSLAPVVRTSPSLPDRDESDSEDEGSKSRKGCFLCFSR